MSPPSFGSPHDTHVTTLRSAKTAAKARLVPQICWTFLSWSLTSKLSPPCFGWPQVTTLSAPMHHTANAIWVAANFGCCAAAAMLSPCRNPESWRESGATSLRKPCPKDFSAAVFKSRMVPNCKTDIDSHRPLGKETDIVRWNCLPPDRFRLSASWHGCKGVADEYGTCELRLLTRCGRQAIS